MILARKGVKHPRLSSKHARADLSHHVGILSLITQIEQTRQQRWISAASVGSSYIPAEGHPLMVWNRELLISFKAMEA